MKPVVKFTVTEGAKLPEYAHDTDSGADLCANEDALLGPGETKLIDTGLKIELPMDYEAQVRSKSGLAAKSGIKVLNSPGTIDQGYRGPIKVILHNTSKVGFSVSKGMKIAQIVVAPYVQADFTVAQQLSSTDRGEAGFGSTGL